MDSNNIEISCGNYLVEKIVGIYIGEGEKRYYNVKWADSWEPEDNLSESCERLIKDFWSQKTVDLISGKDVSVSEIKAGQQVVIEQVNKSTKKETDKFGHSSNLDVTNRPAESVEVKYSDSNDFNPTDDRITKLIIIKSEEGSGKTNVDKNLSNDSTVLTSTSTQTEILFTPQSYNIKSFPEICVDSKCSEVLIKPYTDTLNLNVIEPHTKNLDVLKTHSNILDVSNVSPNVIEDSTVYLSEIDCEKPQNATVLDESRNTSMELESPKSAHDDISDFGSESVSRINYNFDTDDSIGILSKTPSFLPINIDCDSDVINLDDDDLEITATLTTPTRKRGSSFSNNSFSSNSNSFTRMNEFDHSPSQDHSNGFNRLCMTNPVKNTCPIIRNKKPRSSSEERNRNKATSSSMLFHPRRLLQYSSQESDNEDYSFSFQMSKSNDINSLSQYKRHRPRNEILSKSSKKNLDFLRARVLKTAGSLNANQLQVQKKSCNSVTNIDQFHTDLETSSSNGDSQTLTGRTCNLCNITFNNITLARQHVNLIHGKRGNNNSSACTICGGVFRNLRELKSHMLLHGDTEKLHKCDICLLTFKHRSVLNQHLLIHSGDLPFECEVCQKRFRQQGHLVTHMAQHDDNMNLTCPRCIIEFPSSLLYSKHMNEHNSELAFHCELCDESFQIKNDLKLHLQAHDDGRPFFCHLCKKSFKTKGYLLGHIQMHKYRVSSNN